ncbi:hypothetical protein ACFVYV_42735 [Streptomyces mirabilis]|jgi:hypothetical protein|uniref:hypothetical protein n=1 Tax=Streptomyces mirabilis TaxID=68239 RepID=UPI0036D977EC
MTIADAGFMPGIELSQVLYEEAVRPFLGEVFAAGGRLRSGNTAEPTGSRRGFKSTFVSAPLLEQGLHRR